MHAFVPQETKGRESSVSTEDRFIDVSGTSMLVVGSLFSAAERFSS